MKSTAPADPAVAVRILKSGTCPSSSGKSTLSYQVGTSDSDILIRVHRNSGTGFFSDAWVPLTAIQQALSKKGSEKHFTSFALHSLYRGKSINTPGFLLAALRSEGLVQASKDVRRCYEKADPAPFWASVQAALKGAGPGAKTAGGKAATKSGPAAPAGKTPSKSTKKT